jgi:putative sterol carrier protein
MHPAIFTAPWTAAWRDAINASDDYRVAAARWEGAIVFVVDGGDGASERAAYADLWHGECRDARPALPGDRESAAYVIRASPAVWESILSGTMEPISALMLGRLKLERGSLAALALQVKAARAMVQVAGAVTAALPPQ